MRDVFEFPSPFPSHFLKHLILGISYHRYNQCNNFFAFFSTLNMVHTLHNNSTLANVSSLLSRVIMNDSTLETGTNALNDSKSGYFYGPDSMSLLYIAWLCIAAIIFVPGILANCMILAVILKIDKLRTASNHLICSLAIADLMMMIIMAGFVFSDIFMLDISASLNAFLWPSFDLFIGSASIISLAGVSVDRAIAVFKPLQYQEISNRKQAVTVVKFTWLYSIFAFILSMLRCVIEASAYRNAILYIFYVISFLLPFAIIIISYTFIVSATIKNVQLSRSTEKVAYNATFRLNGTSASKYARIRRLRIQEVKIAANFAIILLPFVTCWGFFFGTHFYEDVTKNYQRTDLYEWFLLTLPWMSSSINPLIYMLSISSLRNGCKKLMCKKRYLAQARESVITTLLSKRGSDVDEGACRSHAEKKSIFSKRSIAQKFARRSKSNREHAEDEFEMPDENVISPLNSNKVRQNKAPIHLVVKSLTFDRSCHEAQVAKSIV